jgi:hypothetical protein
VTTPARDGKRALQGVRLHDLRHSAAVAWLMSFRSCRFRGGWATRNPQSRSTCTAIGCPRRLIIRCQSLLCAMWLCRCSAERQAPSWQGERHRPWLPFRESPLQPVTRRRKSNHLVRRCCLPRWVRSRADSDLITPGIPRADGCPAPWSNPDGVDGSLCLTHTRSVQGWYRRSLGTEHSHVGWGSVGSDRLAIPCGGAR